MKAYGGVDLLIHIFLTSALVGGEWSSTRLCSYTPIERVPGTHLIGGWFVPRSGLDDVEMRKFLTLPELKLRTLGHPARSQSLYRLRYPGCLEDQVPVYKSLSKSVVQLYLQALGPLFVAFYDSQGILTRLHVGTHIH
jgi:hypothetical protein